jgi:hypothetical protein
MLLQENQQPGRNDIELTTSFQETDSLVFQLPRGYIAGKPMDSRQYASSFCSYNFHTELKGDSLFITCHFQQNKGLYPAMRFSKLVQFFNLVYWERMTELVMIRKQ